MVEEKFVAVCHHVDPHDVALLVIWERGGTGRRRKDETELRSKKKIGVPRWRPKCRKEREKGSK